MSQPPLVVTPEFVEALTRVGRSLSRMALSFAKLTPTFRQLALLLTVKAPPHLGCDGTLVVSEHHSDLHWCRCRRRWPGTALVRAYPPGWIYRGVTPGPALAARITGMTDGL